MVLHSFLPSYTLTCESVGPGHPDKLCDQCADALVDAYLALDPNANTAIEVMATKNKVILAGEVKSEALLTPNKIEEIVRHTIRDIGYVSSPDFHWEKLIIENTLHSQAPTLAAVVSQNVAGDQGIMIGYACDETPQYLPLPTLLAHNIMRLVFDAIHANRLPGIGPDAKSQVTVRYGEKEAIAIESIVISIQHHPDISPSHLQGQIRPYIMAALPTGWHCPDEAIHINPGGIFPEGGPAVDTGLTGRKIVVDTYGPHIPHGGGSFSGKDPSKMDRTGAYMGRYLAKNIVAAGLATQCLIQLTYTIGMTKPTALYASTLGTGIISDSELQRFLLEECDLSPGGIIERLHLRQPIYKPTSLYGHFGRLQEGQHGYFSWEATNLSLSTLLAS